MTPLFAVRRGCEVFDDEVEPRVDAARLGLETVERGRKPDLDCCRNFGRDDCARIDAGPRPIPRRSQEQVFLWLFLRLCRRLALSVAVAGVPLARFARLPPKNENARPPIRAPGATRLIYFYDYLESENGSTPPRS